MPVDGPCVQDQDVREQPTDGNNDMAEEGDASRMVDGIVIVVSPLLSLMSTQVARLQSLGISAAYIGSENFRNDFFVQGKYQYVFGNPENFLLDPVIWKSLKNPSLSSRVICLVFDEVHTALSWGVSTDRQEAFRGYFSKVGDIRARLTDVPLICLTATASQTTRMKIRDLLSLKDPVMYSKSPDRTNVRMCIMKMSTGPQCLDFLLCMLRDKKELCPKTLVFCRKLQDCSRLYLHFKTNLHMDTGSDDPSTRLFDMVHSKTPEGLKQSIVNSLMDMNLSPRVVFATKILGLGVDARVQNIIHYGPPTSVDDYLQQLGRAGRDSSNAHAMLLYNGTQLRNTDPAMLKVLKEKDITCHRILALRDFGVVPTKMNPAHQCCTFCAAQCKCENCYQCLSRYEQFHTENSDVEELNEPVRTRFLSMEERQHIGLNIIDLKAELDQEVLLSVPTSFVQPEIVHSLTLGIVALIVEKLDLIFSVDDIIELCHIGNYSTASRLIMLLSKLLKDIDTDTEVSEDIVQV